MQALTSGCVSIHTCSTHMYFYPVHVHVHVYVYTVRHLHRLLHVHVVNFFCSMHVLYL